MRTLTAFFLKDVLGGKTVPLVCFLFWGGTFFFILSSRPQDALATRIIDAEVYAKDYLFASMYFLRFTSLFFIATMAAHLFSDRKDHPLLARTSRRRIFLAKSAAVMLSGTVFVLGMSSVLLFVYALTPFRRAFGPPDGMHAALFAHVVHASSLCILVALTLKKAGVYLVILPGYLFADLLCDFPLDKDQTGPATFIANVLFANIHPQSAGGFTFLASPIFMAFFACALLFSAFVIHETCDF